jgi:hypothetical protein
MAPATSLTVPAGDSTAGRDEFAMTCRGIHMGMGPAGTRATTRLMTEWEDGV